LPRKAGVLTAFLERFFDRYVAYFRYRRHGRRAGRCFRWPGRVEAGAGQFWRDFKPKSDEVMEKKPSEVTAELDVFLERLSLPAARRRHDPRECPKCGNGRWRCAAAAMARSLPARTIPSASSPASLPSPAGRGRRGRDAPPARIRKPAWK
jgi:DNA topoisomerase-1